MEAHHHWQLVCFLSSAASNAAPAVAPAADKIFEFSDETTEMSKAVGFFLNPSALYYWYSCLMLVDPGSMHQTDNPFLCCPPQPVPAPKDHPGIYDSGLLSTTHWGTKVQCPGNPMLRLAIRSIQCLPCPVQEYLSVLVCAEPCTCLHLDRQMCIVEGFHQYVVYCGKIWHHPLFYKLLHHGGLRGHIETHLKCLTPATTSLQFGTPLDQDESPAMEGVIESHDVAYLAEIEYRWALSAGNKLLELKAIKFRR